MLAARDRVKTMASRTPSTLNGHPEVIERRATTGFSPLLANTKSQATSFLAYDWTTRPSEIQRPV